MYGSHLNVEYTVLFPKESNAETWMLTQYGNILSVTDVPARVLFPGEHTKKENPSHGTDPSTMLLSRQEAAVVVVDVSHLDAVAVAVPTCCPDKNSNPTKSIEQSNATKICRRGGNPFFDIEPVIILSVEGAGPWCTNRLEY